MKMLKRLLVLALALALVLAAAVPALAATITINKTIKDQEYKAYKIFDVVKNGDSYAYSIAENSPWFDTVKAYHDTHTETRPFRANFSNIIDGKVIINPVSMTTPTLNEQYSKDFADYLATHIPSGAPSSVQKSTADNSSVTIDVGENPGYYFVTSTLGSLCILRTAADSISLNEKNTRPSITKTSTPTTASVGGQVNFVLNIDANNGANAEYILEDTMSPGLSFTPTKEAFTVTRRTKTVAADIETTVDDTPVEAQYYDVTDTSTPTQCSFKIVFKTEFTQTLTANDAIVISYIATLNENAINADVETNTVKFTYNNIVKTDEASVANHGFSIAKVDSDHKLLTPTAEFKIYTDSNCANELKFVLDNYKNADGTDSDQQCYRPAMTGETPVDHITAGNVKIDGLENKVYYVKETKAPDNYNIALSAEKITIDGDDEFNTVDAATQKVDGGVRVINRKGSIIPETGGIGTTIFYVLGSILLIGAGVLLVTRKRMNTTK